MSFAATERVTITFFERVKNNASGEANIFLGKEIYENIEEAIGPSSASHSVFCVKKFHGDANYNWFVKEVHRATLVPGSHSSFAVELTRQQQPAPEVYLGQLTVAASRRLFQGTLVEVDYGFLPDILCADGRTKANNRYFDLLQHGEMHKRRLAIVVKAAGGAVQVVPVTSVMPSNTDKTSFELSAETLKGVHFYSSSGKQSWALCNMIETVSAERVLPPLTEFTSKGRHRVGRDNEYRARISAKDGVLFKAALLHSIGIPDYATLQQSHADRLIEQKQLTSALEQAESLKGEAEQLKIEVSDLKLVERVAREWDESLNQLDQRVLELRAQDV